MIEYQPILVIFLTPWAISVWAAYMMIVTARKHSGAGSAGFFVAIVRAPNNRGYFFIFTGFALLEILFFALAIQLGLSVPFGLNGV